MIAHSAYVMTLANSIIGVGILAMPFCFQKCGIILATLLLIASNWITRISCHYLIKCSLLTRRKSFEFLGLHAFGTSGKLMVELCIIGYLLGTCITYFVVVGDLGPQIVTKILSLDGGHLHLRTLIMIAVTLICILPLGMLRNVDSLATVCTASIGFYICLVVKIILESTEHIITGYWTEKVVYWQPGGVLQCLPIFSMALSCQMQLFEVFESINNQSLDKLNGIVRHATWICTCVYIAVGFFGYVAFCTQTFSGNILIYLSESFGSDVIKLGFILSVAFSFPLVIFPCRASIYSLLYRKGQTDSSGYIPESRFKAITLFIVGFALSIALMIPSVELVIGLVGSTIGVAICIMFPAFCFRKIVQKDSTERMVGYFILVSGFCLMILGTYANLSAIDAKHSGAHLAVPPAKIDEIPVTLSAHPADNIIEAVEHNKLNEAKKDDSKKLSENVNKPIEDFKDPEKGNELKNSKEKLKDLELKENIKKIISSKPSPPLPPIPIDEKHVLQEKEDLYIPPVRLETEGKPKENKISLAKNKTVLQVLTPQTINKDATRKDKQITAEEIKKDEKSNTNEELKKTQNELKKTKELLQRTVGELKEELAKQNEETQNLVVEKLDAVVEKVNQIEQHVKQRDEKEKKPGGEHIEINSGQGDAGQSKNTVLNMSVVEKQTKLLSVTNISASLEKLSDSIPSRKSISNESISNMGKVGHRYLAVPLPLLVNNTLSKNKDGANIENSIINRKGNPALEANVMNDSKGELISEKHREQFDEKSASKGETKKLITNSINKDDQIDKENIDLLRSNLHQKQSQHLENNAARSASPAEPDEKRDRIKRFSHQIIDVANLKINNRIDKSVNDLPSIEMDLLLGVGINNAMNSKFGRELKFVNVENAKR